MAFCPAATATAAIFTALIVLDIVNKNYNDILLHVSGGIFSVVGIFVMCNALGDLAGWGMLMIPFIVLLVGFLLIWIDGRKDTPAPVSQEEEQLCNLCGYMPCQCGGWVRREPPPCKGSSQPVLPPSVVNTPPAPSSSDLGCPPKKA